MTDEEIERYRQNLNDPFYIDNAVKHIVKEMTNGNVVLEIVKGKRRRREVEKFCPCCKTVKHIDEFHSKYGTKLPYCKVCSAIKSKIYRLKKKGLKYVK
jgi:hypothetical protein